MIVKERAQKPRQLAKLSNIIIHVYVYVYVCTLLKMKTGAALHSIYLVASTQFYATIVYLQCVWPRETIQRGGVSRL